MNSVVLDWNLTLGCVCERGRERGWGGTRRGGVHARTKVYINVSPSSVC